MDSLSQLQADIVACRKCVNLPHSAIFPSPRYGFGPKKPKLVIYGQNPPAEDARCLHGAWMIHYPPAGKETHELLLTELLAHLGLKPAEVYAANVVRCPTEHNSSPGCRSTEACAPFLLRELNLLSPRVILTMGTTAYIQVFQAWMKANPHPSHVGSYATVPVGASLPSNVGVKRFGDNFLIEAPHPSRVTRFIDKASWLSAIGEAYAYTLK